jgi:DNA-damage-inducible protein D
MNKENIKLYKSTFDTIVHFIRNEENEQVEVWFACELQSIWGYARWENFLVAIH